MLLLTLSAVFLLSPGTTSGQFPAICNTPGNLQSKTCCPNNCGGAGRGTCENITATAARQWQSADPTVTNILLDAPNNPQKGTADSRYLWPTIVFENVCNCHGNFGGVDCSECDFGWIGKECTTRKTVTRRSFRSLSEDEKNMFVQATADLKNEMGVWSVIVEEPLNYSSGTVTLQNVSTYDVFVYFHNFVARDDSRQCGIVNNNIGIDFAHAGPVFPVWHRHYLLILEREYQRITNNPLFGLPYWQWEENDQSMFTPEYYGTPANSNNSATAINVSGQVINPTDWNTACDILYWSPNLTGCIEYWKPCNPANDLAERRPLQRGGQVQFDYLPNIIEVMIAISAPSYDAPDAKGQYSTDDPRASFRSRLEGWNIICSAINCTGGPDPLGHQHMHNNVHNWMGGQMDVVPAAVNEPAFNLHHANVDRILESWIQRFAKGNSNPGLLPAYVPVSGGHPGHNRDDYIVPFFPVITAGMQYRVAEEFGYTYDNLISADIPDEAIPDCNTNQYPYSCPICDANRTCINCTSQMCPAPTAPPPTSGVREDSESDSPALPIGLGLGLGIPLLVAVVAILILIIYIIRERMKESGGVLFGAQSLEMTAAT